MPRQGRGVHPREMVFIGTSVESDRTDDREWYGAEPRWIHHQQLGGVACEPRAWTPDGVTGQSVPTGLGNVKGLQHILEDQGRVSVSIDNDHVTEWLLESAKREV